MNKLFEDEILKSWEKELEGYKEWVKFNFNKVPDEVKAILVRGQLETEARIKARKNDFL